MPDRQPSLDERVHQRVRLAITAALAGVESASFSFLRDELGLTDGNLSRHLQVLEEAGFVRLARGFVGKKPRQTVSLTAAGRKAFAAEVAALQAILGTNVLKGE